MNTIEVSGLTKRFDLATRHGQKARSIFTALEDVSFSAASGETIGIIGRNGAGKSTLLKLLAGILRPSSGTIQLRGRVGSLLEVGTGFHPELSGRDNIFLNAAILGMNRSEIRANFDAIVAFAGVEAFLDEPVKHYSSGMYMRLAFAIAAHVQPEILLLDEVLAVGDAEFQRKCIERVEETGRNGQTVLFVSHNIHAVLRLCTRAVLLDGGRVAAIGSAREVAALYTQLSSGDSGERSYPDAHHAPGDTVARLRLLRVCSNSGATLRSLDIGERFAIEMHFDVLIAGFTLFPTLVINNEWGPICWTTDAAHPAHGQPRPAGSYRIKAWFPAHFLTAGRMTVTASMTSFTPHTVHFQEVESVGFQALETFGGSRGHFTGHIDGGIRPLLSWDEEVLPPSAEESR